MTDVDRRRLVFRVGAQNHEIDANLVREVVRASHITRVPHGPEALAGIANLRGKPIPVVSMNRFFNTDDTTARNHGKIIVYDHGDAVGLLVDEVIRLSADSSLTPLLELDSLLGGAFKVAANAPVDRTPLSGGRGDVLERAELVSLLSFRIAGQLYGLSLEDIREVTEFRGDLSVILNGAPAVLGLIPTRDRVLPLVSLASLLGLNGDHLPTARSRVIVIAYEGDLVGLVVDAIEVIHRLPEQAIDAVPAVLQRGGGDAQIDAIGRIRDGGLLISVLSPKKLFGHHAVAQALGQNTGMEQMERALEKNETFEQILIVELGDERYGLPIGSVDEVVRVPDELTRVPGAPAFIMGLINLRGKAVPLIDQRTRFGTAGSERTSKVRAIIVTIDSLRAGFIVDGVSEVRAISSEAISAAPEFSSNRTNVFNRIAHDESDGRMILLIDPQELLTRAEQDIVASIADDTAVAGS